MSNNPVTVDTTSPILGKSPRSRFLGSKSKFRLLLQSLLLYAVCSQVAVVPAVAIDLTPKLPNGAGRGFAYDEVSNRLYFLQPTTGALSFVELNPGCEAGLPPSSCKVIEAVKGFDEPFDVAVNAAAGLAYVTTNSNVNLPTPPALWKVDLKSKKKDSILTGLGPLSRIVLAPEINSVYITNRKRGVRTGELWRVDLSTGNHSVLVQGLNIPGGFVVNADRTLAYVTEATTQQSTVISEINLGTGERTRTVASGDTFDSLAWTDSSESALYVTRGDALSSSGVLRVDLLDSTQTVVVNFRTGNCTPACEVGLHGLAVNPSGSGIYAGLRGDRVIRVPLSAVPDPDDPRIFMRIGDIPVKDISVDGYATFAQFVDSPFGGTLDLYGNFTKLLNLKAQNRKAAKYKIFVSRVLPGGKTGPPIPVLTSWTNTFWNPNAKPVPHYELKIVAPDPEGFYSIPPEYSSPKTILEWGNPFLMLRWPTSDIGDNGRYKLEIQVFTQNGKFSFPLPNPSVQDLIVEIDNTPPVADLTSIRAHDTREVIGPCAIVSPPTSNSFDFELTAFDANGHLRGYSLSAVWGRNRSGTILSESYSNNPPSHRWDGFKNQFRPATDGWKATCNCAHTFTLDVWKRTINGYKYILSSSSSESITINNTSNSCQ